MGVFGKRGSTIHGLIFPMQNIQYILDLITVNHDQVAKSSCFEKVFKEAKKIERVGVADAR